MRCDNCDSDLEGKRFRQYYGFNFCLPEGEQFSAAYSNCEIYFGAKLWEAAKADKEAKRIAAKETAKVGGSPESLVERERIQREAINLRDL